MEDFLQDLYRMADIRTKLMQIIKWSYRYDRNEIRNTLMDDFEKDLEWIKDIIATYDSKEAYDYWNVVKKAIMELGQNDSFASDIFAKHVLPHISNCIKHFGNIAVEDEDNRWQFVSTESGYITLKDITRNIYIHSAIDPMEEARIQAEEIYKPSVMDYVFLGCGLGYLPYKLYELSYKAANIIIFEKNKELIDYALAYGVLGRISENKIQVYIFDDILDFLEYIMDKKYKYHLYRSLYDVEMNEADKDAVDGILIAQNTSRFLDRIEVNFWNNLKNITNNVSKLANTEEGRDIVIVAAGPSVESEFEYLRSVQEHKIIIAVGTILERLLREDIRPTYAAIMDPQERTFRQIEGILDANIPMIIGSGAYWKIAEEYSGEKYLAFLGGPTPATLECISKSGEPIIRTGGTVTSLAVEIAAYMGAKTIELIGVDLAYANNKSHAGGTMHEKEKNIGQAMMEVEGVSGEMVKTTRVLKGYISEIEEQIQRHSDIKFINRSKIGAKIQGAEMA